LESSFVSIEGAVSGEFTHQFINGLNITAVGDRLTHPRRRPVLL
jgi:hypothetical protein